MNKKYILSHHRVYIIDMKFLLYWFQEIIFIVHLYSF